MSASELHKPEDRRCQRALFHPRGVYAVECIFLRLREQTDAAELLLCRVLSYLPFVSSSPIPPRGGASHNARFKEASR